MRDWDEHYRNPENLETQPRPLLERAVEAITPGRALDIACGAGRHSLFLASRGWRVTAVDASPVAISLVREQAARLGVAVDARVADLERDEFVIEPDAWDLVCDFFFLQRNLLPHIREGVRPGGLFVATIHLFDDSPDATPRNPDFLLRRGELEAAFAGWTILEYSEGKPNGGRRGVAELIARRD